MGAMRDGGQTASDHRHDRGCAAAPARPCAVGRSILPPRRHFAEMNRRYLAAHGIFLVNLVAPPGAGRRALLRRTVTALRDEMPIAVIDGDGPGGSDAACFREAGATVLQAGTGAARPLDAHLLGHALGHLPVIDDGMVFVRNAGTLDATAGVDLGEACRVAMLPASAGAAAPRDHARSIDAADLLLIGKADLAPGGIGAMTVAARRVHPAIEVLRVSAATGEGLAAWCDWLRRCADAARQAHIGRMLARHDRR